MKLKYLILIKVNSHKCFQKMLTFYFRVIFTVIAFCVTYLSYLTMHNSRTNSTVPARLARLTFKINEFSRTFYRAK